MSLVNISLDTSAISSWSLTQQGGGRSGIHQLYHLLKKVKSKKKKGEEKEEKRRKKKQEREF